MGDPVAAITGRIRRSCGALTDMRLESRSSQAWHSLLFDGDRHRIELSVSSIGADEALAALRHAIDNEDLDIPGHLVAEIRLAAIERRATEAVISLELLTIAG